MSKKDGLFPEERELVNRMRFLKSEAEDSNRRGRIITRLMSEAGMVKESIEAQEAQRKARFVRSALQISPALFGG